MEWYDNNFLQVAYNNNLAVSILEDNIRELSDLVFPSNEVKGENKLNDATVFRWNWQMQGTIIAQIMLQYG